MEEDNAAAALDNIVTEFQTYEDFLDSQITSLDLYYLEDEDLARQLVELGYRGSGEVLKREEFETRKAAAEASWLSKRNQQKTLASVGKELKDNFLKALAEREEANRSGKMTSIIFIRDRNALGQEISGYIDYSHRLKTEEFEPYFNGKKRLLPRATDLRPHLVTTPPGRPSSLNSTARSSSMTTSPGGPSQSHHQEDLANHITRRT
ncbi:cilia- and flagella-associated protein 299 isoform X2 [Salvelinus fontinalis]|uniref:cilia- and flagella-associated protein 299 isoform X2 n=1 Tax=Salvelinus fontinalis TaxID=8038 RepID=UPI00248552E0|nr:cilia- and flagella-associated protein 299 isoform X2 [Salvelinus fontinalis]